MEWRTITQKDIQRLEIYDKGMVADNLKLWINMNRERKSLFESSLDPKIVTDFLKEYPQALKEPWVVEIISGWLMDGRSDLLKPVTALKRGENTAGHEREVENLMIHDKVWQLKRTGLLLTQAFQAVSESESPVFKNHLSFARVKNIYYQVNNRKPQIVCREEADCFVLYIFPLVGEVQETGDIIYGRWELKIAK